MKKGISKKARFMRLGCLFLAIVFPYILRAQTKLSQEQVLKDFTIFKTIITTGHPALYEYETKEKWDSIFSYFEQVELKQITNSNDLYKSLCNLASYVKDGHLIVHHAVMDSVPKMFPLQLKIINGNLYTDTDENDVPVGSQILTIDGISGNQLIQKMLKYAPSDGFNLTKKYRQIEVEFGILYYYEFGEKTSYTVSFLTPDSKTITTDIEGQTFQQIGQQFALRNSHFAAYHHFNSKREYFEKRINEKWPYYYFIDSINTVVLTVNSFGQDPKEFKSRLVSIFKEIRKKKGSQLIIDIRANNGGYRLNAINLFSFLTDEAFRQRTSESVVLQSLPEEKYVQHTLSNYQQFFSSYFASAIKHENSWLLESDHAKDEMKPNRRTFNGKVYVLIGGNTFSAGSAFALNAKNDSTITLVGEEAGGGYYFHTGQFPVLYELPNSKVMFRMSLVKINHFVKDNTIAKGSGVLPDITVPLTVQDLIESRDSQLDYVIKYIQKLK